MLILYLISRILYLFLFAGQQCFTGAEDIACAHGDDYVTFPDDILQIVGNLRQGLAEDSAGNLVSQMRGGNTDGVALTGCVDLRQDGHIRFLQLLNKFMEQGIGTAVPRC